jgi:hypothetical protein
MPLRADPGPGTSDTEQLPIHVDGDSLLKGRALESLMTLEHYLNPEGKMAAHLNREVAPGSMRWKW